MYIVNIEPVFVWFLLACDFVVLCFLLWVFVDWLKTKIKYNSKIKNYGNNRYS